MVVTDKEQFTAMLTAAGITWSERSERIDWGVGHYVGRREPSGFVEDPPGTMRATDPGAFGTYVVYRPLPEGSTLVEVTGAQPYPGGMDFIVGVAFGPDGNLLALWSTE